MSKMGTTRQPRQEYVLLAQKFCNGMFQGHAELYLNDLAIFLEDLVDEAIENDREENRPYYDN